MELTYGRMNRKLSFAAAIPQALLIVMLALALFTAIPIYIANYEIYASISTVIQSLLAYIANLLYAIMLFAVLLRAKKDVLSGIFLLLPVATSSLTLAISVVGNILFSISEGVSVSYGSIVLSAISCMELLLIRGVLATACFTKGRLFGEKWRIVLPIIAGVCILMDLTSKLLSGVLLTAFSSGVIFFGYKEIFLMTLKDPTIWISILQNTPVYAATILMALSFYFPGKQKAQICEE